MWIVSVNAIGNSSSLEEFLGRTIKKNDEKSPSDLGKDQFIQLLITQLRYQDPMNPTEDKEFIGQMAQFSSLEQMQNLNQNFLTIKGTSLLGKEVKGTMLDPITSQPTIVEGMVTGVKISNGSVLAVVNGREMPVERVTEIFEPISQDFLEE